ncbi:MAG: gluconate 2-dehydrogenase subunit 3 family protein [Bryobacteraceae bacterium]
MKRRQALQAITGLSVTGNLALTGAVQETSTPKPASETPLLETAVADASAAAPAHFFSNEQFAALQRLSEILVPPAGEMPGAKDAGAAAFLDFLLSESPADRQALYRNGLDRLNADARKKYGKAFPELTAPQSDPLLSPLRQAWMYGGPTDPFGQFLQSVKVDVIRATMNSREWALAQQKTSRRGGGLGTYWFPFE